MLKLTLSATACFVCQYSFISQIILLIIVLESNKQNTIILYAKIEAIGTNVVSKFA